MARSKPPLELYREIINDRPKKLTESEVNYRESDSPVYAKRCRRCLHFFERALDGFSVCELMRPDSDESVEPDHVCDFFTRDGEDFPLLGEHENS